MGNYYCKKCGICATQVTNNRPSCRVLSYEEMIRGETLNCRHDFKYRWYLPIMCGVC